MADETKDDFLNIYQLLEHQEGKLLELHQSIRAILQTLKSQPDFFDPYLKHYEAPESSALALDYAPTLQAIREKVRRLRERAA